MEEIVIYRADDGTDFEDEWDCRQYEWGKKTADASYTLLSHKFEILPNNDPNSYEDAFFLFFPTYEATLQLLDNWDSDVISTYSPAILSYTKDNKPGLYAWDERNEEWYHLGLLLDELNTQADKAMRAIGEAGRNIVFQKKGDRNG